ncbi:TolB-like translocation protein [Streptomyces sp. NPDC048182]|uniref:TolB-like translocation protein n=1 Tax=Streptomyces sp. NPDC048182 TaxID=3365507 RepID=UPI00371625A6
MRTREKILVLLAAVVVLAAVSGAALWHGRQQAARKDQAQQGGPPVREGTVSLARGGPARIVFRNTAWGPHRDELTSVPAGSPDTVRTAPSSAPVKCLRFHAAGGTGICLQSEHHALGETYRAVVLDSALHETRRITVPGIPTRDRVSPSGRMVAWTVFVGGDSYAGTDFSTRTGILDTRTGALTPSLESYRVVKDGRTYHAADVNFWGVTFADDAHFYATLGTKGATYLVRGDIARRTVTTVRPNVECPSLSPDGRRLAFKKRVRGADPDAPWRLYVLDLATMRESPLAESRSVDDQAVWSPDGRTVTYELAGDYGADLWTVPADGTGAPHRMTRGALSPAFLR